MEPTVFATSDLDLGWTRLTRLRLALAEGELELARLEADLGVFHARLTQHVGSTVALDGLARAESDPAAARPAEVALPRPPQADAGSAGGADAALRRAAGARSEEAALKDLYREAARIAHPDRSADERTRAFANQLMAEVNLAYGAGDRARLLDLVRQIRIHADGLSPRRAGSALAEVTAKLAVAEAALAQVRARLEALRAGPIYRLMRQFDEVARVGRDPFRDLATALRERLGGAAPAAPPAEAAPGEAAAGGEGPDGAAARLERGWLGERACPTARGEAVRSASLARIADALDEAGLGYRYEQPIVGTIAPGILRPDFAFSDRARRPIVLEHYDAGLGAEALAVAERRRRWFERNGFAAGLGYFVTRDPEPGRPDLEHLRKVAEFIRSRMA